MHYYLSLGSNIGEREYTIRKAVSLLNERAGIVLRVSSFFYSEPWGFESTNQFANIALLLQSDLLPQNLLTTTQAIERELGRTHKTIDRCYHDRTIDIDLLQCFDDTGQELHVNTTTLTLPHPLMNERDFVTQPLQELKD
ncbi:MAG: 2-amino-4-hydroxy-6-hydroxymethyldihydropteridine diphosphokinase [Paludibacteraceae bacterium]|nr:2-amino-4-hydroxy-6-hydroxymethyldihydropteridine diphosphokinase [Paludibacteraceae bacterium]